MSDPLIDPATVACLGGGWHALLAVDEHGEPWPWLIGPECGACTTQRRCGSPTSVHELLGPLPPVFAARVGRCGAPTHTGEPCSRLRLRSRGRCWQHSNSTEKIHHTNRED